MNNLEDYGTFYIFHFSNSNNNSFTNSCYTGYSQNDNLPSFVHGNTVTASKDFNNNKIELGISGKTYFP